MNQYFTLFDIGVEHSFFNGPCSCLEFVPTNNTKRLLENTGIIIRKTNNGIVLAHDRSRIETLQLYLEDDAEGLDFAFKAYSTDPEFHTYTEPTAEIGTKLLFFTNPKADTSPGDLVSLHASELVTTEYLVDIDSIELKGILSHKDLLIPPAFVVRIQVNGKPNCLFDNEFNDKVPGFRVNFNSRQTYWKYYLHDNNVGDSTYVQDPDEKITFESTDPVELPDGRTFLTYRSKETIPLHERYDFRFQLIQRRNGDEKVLFRQLPCAGPGYIEKDVVANQSITVSEIFINY